MSRHPDLYLMRHGETAWNLEGRLQGRGDSPLTARGRRQAAWLGALTRGIAGRRLSSPLGRAAETARIAFGAPVPQDPRLAEICVGRWSGALEHDLRRAHPALFSGGPLDWYDRCPGGEGLAALQARCRSFLDDLTGPTLVVTHGITLRMLRLVALDRPLDQLALGAVRQGGVHVLSGGTESVLRHPDDR